jgi:hypothetical protein
VGGTIAEAPAGARVMDRLVAGRLIDWAVGSRADEATEERFRRLIDEVAAALAGPDPSPIERLLAETAALGWFALRVHETHSVGGSTSAAGLTLARAERGQRRIDRANRRLSSTLRTPATVRRLAVPAVQLDLARQQLNVAGSRGDRIE